MFEAASTERSISVVMATFNGARFVSDQLASVAAQTLRPSELLVGDDGSADATLDIVERFAADAAFPVHIVRNPRRLGAAENFLALSLRAQGPIIALSDWDDVWEPRKLAELVRWFHDPSVQLVVHRSQVVDTDLRPLGRRYPAMRRTTVLPARRVDPWLAVPGMGMAFRKALLEAAPSQATDRPREAGGHPLDHDDWLYFLSGSLGTTVLLADDLALYRQHGASYMGAPGAELMDTVARGLRLGGEDMRRQAAMFRSRRDFLAKVAANPRDEFGVCAEAARSADWCERLAKLMDARSGVRDEERTRAGRLARLVLLTLRGGYRPRTMTGLGLRALAGDILSLLQRGPAPGARAAADDLAIRVAAARAEGRSAEAIIAELTAEGVPPLYGNRWTPEMIRDLVFQARRGAEPAVADSRPGSADLDRDEPEA